MRTRVEEVPVLIVGAGPAGMASAIALARAGVESLVIERRQRPSAHPRATLISLRTMEMLRTWGLEDELRAGGHEVEWHCWQSETLAGAADGYAIDLGVPTREQSELVSPTTPACVPQDHIEPVLERHLRSLGPASLERGAQMLDLERGAGEARALIRDARGEERTVRASHVIAADGAHSGVRQALGIEMSTSSTLEVGVTAVFRAPELWQLLGEIRHGMYSVDTPDGPGVFLPAGRPDRWLFGPRIAAGGPAAEEFTVERLVGLVRAATGLEDLEPEIERTGCFRFVAGLAEAFREDNAFLVGDAAHRVTPRGGSGMNMAIQGGFDLGWKLGWVLRGWAGPGLLDSYERERMPIARLNVERSLGESSEATSSEARLDLGGRLQHQWTSLDGKRRSTLDLLTPGITMFTGPEGRRGHPGHEAGPPITVRRLQAAAAHGLGVQGGAAMLVRPDASPLAWLAPEEDFAGRASRMLSEPAPR